VTWLRILDTRVETSLVSRRIKHKLIIYFICYFMQQQNGKKTQSKTKQTKIANKKNEDESKQFIL
jgi:hypothetical protein